RSSSLHLPFVPGTMLSPLPRLIFSGLAWFSVLCRWWLSQLLGRGYQFSVGFLTVGVSLSLVHCRVSLYLFCCGSAEVLGSWSTVKRSVLLVFSTGSHDCFTVFLSPSGAGPGWGFWLGS